MALFQYKALQGDGTVAEGQLEAGGRQEAFRQMAERGLKPINLSERAAANSQKSPAKTDSSDAANSAKKTFGFQSNKVNSKDLENFTRLLSSLLAAGVPLSRALVILCREATSPA